MVKEVDMTDGKEGPRNYIEGVHPKTGEVLRVAVVGNFPYKDPKTNHFIVDDSGNIILPGRVRERHVRLDSKRQEVPDPRPMSSAVAFAADVSPEEEVRRLIASADARMQANYARADESDQEFYDDDEFDTPEEGGVDNLTSPFEFVRDAVAGCEVPRPIAGTIKPQAKPATDVKDASPLPPKGKAEKPSKKASNADSNVPPDDGED